MARLSMSCPTAQGPEKPLIPLYLRAMGLFGRHTPAPERPETPGVLDEIATPVSLWSDGFGRLAIRAV